MKILRIIHTLAAIALGLFFIYAGSQKLIPKPPPAKPVDNSAFIEAFEKNEFESPVTFRMGIKALKTSGFLKMVGVLQILSGLLIIIPVTRLIGLLMLLPVVVNVFCFHFFMDNQLHENIETGIYLLGTILLIAYYYRILQHLLIRKVYTFK